MSCPKNSFASFRVSIGKKNDHWEDFSTNEEGEDSLKAPTFFFSHLASSLFLSWCRSCSHKRNPPGAVVLGTSFVSSTRAKTKAARRRESPPEEEAVFRKKRKELEADFLPVSLRRRRRPFFKEIETELFTKTDKDTLVEETTEGGCERRRHGPKVRRRKGIVVLRSLSVSLFVRDSTLGRAKRSGHSFL